MLKLMYITNKPWVARIAEETGVDWSFVDMEFIGKDERQAGLDTVKNHHTIEDVARIRASVSKAKVLVRVNPIHPELPDYMSSETEIDRAIASGADIVMLPFFKTVAEVRQFIARVNGRAQTCLLVETPQAALLLDEILEVPGIDMIHIGLNDLHLALGMKFMFELLADGTVERLAAKIKAKGLPFGFGGIATLDGGAMPGSMVLKEHYRLGSSMVIVSRSFCNTDKVTDPEAVRRIFANGIADIRRLEAEAQAAATYFTDNQRAVKGSVQSIIQSK